VNRRRTLSGFELHEQSLLHEQVQARFTDSSTFVEDIDSDLPEKTNAMFCQLLAEGFLIKGLQKPGAQRAMNLNGRPDYYFGQAVQSFFGLFPPAFSLRALCASAVHKTPSAVSSPTFLPIERFGAVELIRPTVPARALSTARLRS
jgi:hypothetical protein